MSGARVILACRTESKALEAIRDIKEKVPDAKLEFIRLDLSDLDSVKEFAQQFKAKGYPLHLLMNNAGVMAIPKYTTSKYGRMSLNMIL